MDTQPISVVVSPSAPDAEALAPSVRRAARVAFELLRVPALPRQVRLLDRAITPATVGAVEPWMQDSAPDGDAGACYSYNSACLTISLPAIRGAAHLGVDPGRPESLEHAISFSTGYAAARFAADAAARMELHPEWVASESRWDEGAWEGHLQRAAVRVASAASGFRLVGCMDGDDPQSEAVLFFLRRLGAIAAREGGASAWRGALGQATRTLLREVRFSPLPGKVSALGKTMPDVETLWQLVAYAECRGPWPFHAV